MKHFYILILMLFVSTLGHAQNNLAKESQQKMLDFTQKFNPAHQLKSAAANANALDKLSYENGAYKEMTYNEKGQLLTYKSYKNKDGTLLLDETETYTYNEHGQELSNVVSRYDDWEKKMLDQWKYEYTYDAQGRILSETAWETGENAAYELEYANKTEYEYNEETVVVLHYDWDNEWELDTKEIMYVRWDMGNVPTIDSARVYIPDEGSNENFIFVGVMTMKYHAPGLMSEMLYVFFDEDTGAERSRMKMETSYNGNGDILSDLTKNYNPAIEEWQTIAKEEFKYNSAGQIIEENYYTLSWTTGVIAPTTQYTYSYDAGGNLSLRQVYVSDFDNGGEMVLSYKYEFKFNDLDTENIMLPPASIGYYYNGDDFYEHEFYKNGAIDEVKSYMLNYMTSALELQKTGKYHYSKHNSVPTAIEPQNNIPINVFPNPFTNEIKLQLEKAGDYQLKIRNGIGQVVYSTNINDATTSHTISNLPSGLYILSVYSDGKRAADYKLIKE